MAEEKCKCVVCKREFEPGTGFVTVDGPICSAVCASYAIQEKQSGRLNESDDLNEVQLLL